MGLVSLMRRRGGAFSKCGSDVYCGVKGGGEGRQAGRHGRGCAYMCVCVCVCVCG